MDSKMTEQEPATYKQIEFAKKLGIENPQAYSKGDLRTLINEKVVKSEEGNGEKPIEQVKYPPKTAESKPVKEFHLSPEQVNTNALDLSIKFWGTKAELSNIKVTAKEFKEFIENGN